MSELKACPCCGSNENIHETHHTTCFDGVEIRSVNCPCGCRILGYDDEARNKWNNRQAENKIKAEGIREALEYSKAVTAINARAVIQEYANKLEKA